MYYPATFTPAEKGVYNVTFVDLPGCVSQGKNLEDALRMASEALTLHLDGMQEDGEPLPKPSSLEEAKIKDEAESKAEGLPLVHGTIYQFVLVNQPKAKAPVRVNISLKPSVVERIDAVAEEMGLTRSALIVVATRDYISRMG